jgi:hypothetical protein
MTQDLGTPIGHQEIIRRINAQKAAEDKARLGQQSEAQSSSRPHERTAGNTASGGQQRCRITAFRDESTGQFYAMSEEDRIAFNDHCQGIVGDLQPANHRERWLANSIAEDQWRLNRARALESNIFALGMSSPALDFNADSPETDAAICQASVWLADGKKLQMLALYESRIRRSIEKNEKQLKELQTERKAAHDKALEEEILLAEFAIAEGETYVYEDSECPAYPGQIAPGAKAAGQNGFEFSSEEITRLAHRRIRLRRAIQLQKQASKPGHAPATGPHLIPKKA